MRWIAAPLLALSTLVGCGLPPHEVEVRLVVAPRTPSLSFLPLGDGLAFHREPPAGALSMSCYLLNVWAPDLDPAQQNLNEQITSSCMKMGAVSQRLVSSAELVAGGLSVRTRAGTGRTVELIGVDQAGCSGRTPVELFAATMRPRLYPLAAQSNLTLVGPTRITLQNTYTADTAANRTAECGPANLVPVIPSVAYSGSTTNQFSDQVAVVSPPLGTSPAPFAPNMAYYTLAAETSAYARVDVILDSSNWEDYSKVKITGSLQGGNSISCDNNTAGGLGGLMKVYDGSRSAWSSEYKFETSEGSSVTPFEIVVENPQRRRVLTEDLASALNLKRYLYASFRSKTLSDGILAQPCSFVRFVNLDFRLMQGRP